MDADFSHDPADLARLLRRGPRRHADLVLGSRYVARRRGGRLGSTARRWLSRGGCWYARTVSSACGSARPHRRLQVLPPRGARGDRPAHRALAGLRVPGRADLPRRARRRFRVVEVPIIFSERAGGTSKMSPGSRWRPSGSSPSCASAPLTASSPRTPHYTLYSKRRTASARSVHGRQHHRRHRHQLPGRGHRVRHAGARRLLGARGAVRAASSPRCSRRSTPSARTCGSSSSTSTRTSRPPRSTRSSRSRR